MIDGAREDTLVSKTSVRLADGRELVYFGVIPERPAGYPDLRQLAAVQLSSQRRYDPLLGEWVAVAGRRQHGRFQSADDHCPLCPSTSATRTEVPAPAYDVVVLENRFPALAAEQDQAITAGRPADHGDRAAEEGTERPDGPLLRRPAAGRCEVVCFSQEHTASFADLTPGQAAIVVEAWTDRTAELSMLLGVEQVFCFENRGAEMGATLSHPHGQIYGYPFVTPRTSRMLWTSAAYRQRTGLNLFDQVLQAERSDGSRIVAAGEHWTAFVPHAARWAYEVHLYPNRRVPDLAALSNAARAEFCDLYLDMLRRFDRLFDAPAPYISALHQAPVRHGRDELALHLELFTIRRAAGKLQYLAASESGMGVFANSIVPESAAARLRQLG
jgi:UDPglucose--hexose-1-phosphate uridylyltransferase